MFSAMTLEPSVNAVAVKVQVRLAFSPAMLGKVVQQPADDSGVPPNNTWFSPYKMMPAVV